MTLASIIIQRAYRESNIIPVGTQPSTSQQIEALAVLNSGIRSLPGSVFSENLTDWGIPFSQRVGNVAANSPLYPGSARPIVPQSNPYPPKNTRMVWDGSTQTVYMPENPPDGARMALVQSAGNGQQTPGLLTLSGNGRTVEGSANYLSSTATHRNWLYRADLGDWVRIYQDLLASDNLPFPDVFDDFFITGLAIRMSPMYGKTIQAATTGTYTRMASMIRARYFQPTSEPRGGEELVPGYESFWTGWSP